MNIQFGMPIDRISNKDYCGIVTSEEFQNSRMATIKKMYHIQLRKILSMIHVKDKSMAQKTTRFLYDINSDRTISTRKSHKSSVLDIAMTVGAHEKFKGLIDLDELAIGAEFHDLHSFDGHSGSWWISNDLENLGLGKTDHNAQGARIPLLGEGIHKRALEATELIYGKLTKEEIRILEHSCLNIFDMILCHDGEGTVQRIKPDYDKTDEQFYEELMSCYVDTNNKPKIKARTLGGCLLLFADKQSYYLRDGIDALKNGFIDTLDDQYLDRLSKLGIPREFVQDCLKKKDYDRLDQAYTLAASIDIINNSTRDEIAMSDNFHECSGKLRVLNNEGAVNFYTRDPEQEIFPRLIAKWREKCVQALVKTGRISDLGSCSGDPDAIESMLSTLGSEDERRIYDNFFAFVGKTTPEDFESLKVNAELAISKSIEVEIRDAGRDIEREVIAQKSGEGEDFTYVEDESDKRKKNKYNSAVYSSIYEGRNQRTTNYASYLRQVVEEHPEFIEEFCREIEVDGKKKTVRSLRISASVYQKFIDLVKSSNLQETGYPSFEEQIAALKFRDYASYYLDELDVIRELLNHDLIKSEEVGELFRPYSSMSPKEKKAVHTDPNWKGIEQEQKAATEKAEEEDDTGDEQDL